MTSKALTIKGSVKGIAYVMNDKGHAQEVITNLLLGDTPSELYAEMRQIANHSQNHISKAFFTAFFSPHAQYTQGWGIAEWRNLTEQIIKALDLQQNQFVCYLHQSTKTPHIHIYANRIDLNGKNHIVAHNIAQKVQAIAAEISQNHQWKTAFENGQKQKVDIKELLIECMASARSRDELDSMMKSHGWLLRWNERNGQVTGLRIVPKTLYERNLENPLKALSGQKLGYKLSEIDRALTVSVICEQIGLNAEKENGLDIPTTMPIFSDIQNNINTIDISSVSHYDSNAEDNDFMIKKKKKPKNNDITFNI
jgi:hypothetical protein